MKKQIISALLLSSSALYAANPLYNYNEVLNHFEAGDSLKLKVVLDNCHAPAFLGSGIEFTIDANPIMKLGSSLKFSHTHHTRNHPKHRGESVLEYLQYALGDDNRLYVSVQTLDVKTHQPLDPEMKFSCDLGKAALFFSNH